MVNSPSWKAHTPSDFGLSCFGVFSPSLKIESCREGQLISTQSLLLGGLSRSEPVISACPRWAVRARRSQVGRSDSVAGGLYERAATTPFLIQFPPHKCWGNASVVRGFFLRVDRVFQHLSVLVINTGQYFSNKKLQTSRQNWTQSRLLRAYAVFSAEYEQPPLSRHLWEPHLGGTWRL